MYLKKFLENNNQYQEGKTQYEFGEEIFHEHKNKEAKHIKYEPQINLSTNWNQKINISKQANKLWDLENESANNLKYGTLLHTALAHIKNQTDVIPGLKGMLEEGLINELEMQELERKITAIINHPDICNYFGAGLTIKNEAEILLKDGSIYRPDRVILEEGKAVVIDYKTGKEALKHHEQLLLYGNLLHEMGYKEVERFLIYTEELKIEMV